MIRNKTTLWEFIRQECACLVGGECIGVDAFGVGFREQGKCRILSSRPCEYFVKAVLPIANVIGCYDQVMKQYQDIDLSIRKEKVRVCSCGAELSKRERFCIRCRKARRRKTDRENHRKSKAA
ncbi:MAG: hypothetical protein MRK01_01635 [Candidatus Scalindua sp.]|nr:hypothetical protein [Candidatus Scalindua sp.]